MQIGMEFATKQTRVNTLYNPRVVAANPGLLR